MPVTLKAHSYSLNTVEKIFNLKLMQSVSKDSGRACWKVL